MTFVISLLCWAAFMFTLYMWIKQKCSYWQRYNIPFVKPLPLLGNLKELLLLRISFGEYFQQMYAHAIVDPNAPVLGIYVLHTPALIIRDTNLIRQILIKDFHMFLNRYEAADPYHDKMGSLALPLAKYPIWRESRKQMSEFFTSGRLKQRIYPLMLRIAADLEQHVAQQLDGNAANIEVKEICALYTTDLTALLSFGVFASGLRQGDSEMRRQCCALFKANPLKAFNFFLVFFLPHYTSLLHAKVFSKEYANFWRAKIASILSRRARHIKYRVDGDLIDILTKFQENASSSGPYNYANHADFIASQAAIFMLAGFETSSAIIAFTLYELAKQTTIQERLREQLKMEFEQAQSDKLSYECLTNTDSYLHMVVAEALRMYPAAAFINRECTPSIEAAGYSLQPYVDFIIPSGMPAYISILGIQRDAKYWPQPHHFDPERFAADKLATIHPMTYIPFGAGPHGCIGSRLGILQVKLGLVHILKHYKVETCSRTVSHIKFDPKYFMLHAEAGIYLRFVKNSLVNN